MRLSCLKLLPTSPTTLSTALPLAAPALLNARDTDFNIITDERYEKEMGTGWKRNSHLLSLPNHPPHPTAVS